MVVRPLIASLEKLKEHLSHSSSQGIDLSKKADASSVLYDFKEKRADYMRSNVSNAMLEVKKSSADLMRACAEDSSKEQVAYDLSVQVRFLEEFYKDPSKAMPIITKIIEMVRGLDVGSDAPVKTNINFRITKLPDDVRSEVMADVDELDKCFNSGCYRSCIILCGRILETVLHRKYYDATGQDILEKSPGIGLGNLIGKLKDKNIAFDPGLSQQIHLINQVRIFSVHKKQEAFHPGKDQTHAIILYTLDVVRRIL